MKNLFKIHNKKQAMLNSQDVLSPTVFNCIFEENEAKNSPNKKVEIMCDKLMNNENDVKDELLKVDNCVTLIQKTLDNPLPIGSRKIVTDYQRTFKHHQI